MVMGTSGAVVLFTGVSRYEALICFAEGLAEGLIRLGYDAVILDLTSACWSQQLGSLLATKGIAFAIGMNGVGSDISYENKKLFEQLHVPFISYFVDHPIHQWDRLVSFPQHIMAFADRTHLDFMDDWRPDTGSKLFLPQGGVQLAADGAQIPTMNERDVDVLFIGSITDPEAIVQEWEQFGPLQAVLWDIVNICLWNADVSLAQGAQQAFMARGLELVTAYNERWWPLLQSVDLYIRARRRRRVLEQLAALPLTVVGDGWEYLRDINPNVRVLAPLDYLEGVQLMRRAKTVINVLPNYPQGGHDRVFNAMLQGALCVSDSSGYLCDSFTTEQQLVLYKMKDNELWQLPENIGALLADQPRLEAIAEAGRREVLQRHTWYHRAQALAWAVETHVLLTG